jgi:hypothetical protein
LPLEHGVWPALPQRAEVIVSKRLAPIPQGHRPTRLER